MILLSEVSYTEKDKHQISLKSGTEDMTQMNTCMKQKHPHGLREQTCGFQASENSGSRRLRLRYIN